MCPFISLCSTTACLRMEIVAETTVCVMSGAVGAVSLAPSDLVLIQHIHRGAHTGPEARRVHKNTQSHARTMLGGMRADTQHGCANARERAHPEGRGHVLSLVLINEYKTMRDEGSVCVLIMHTRFFIPFHGYVLVLHIEHHCAPRISPPCVGSLHHLGWWESIYCCDHFSESAPT